LLATAKQYEDKPIVFIAVNSGNPPAQVAAYAREHRITWPIIADFDRQFERRIGLQEITLQNIHQAYIISSNGKLSLGQWSNIPGTVERALNGASWRIAPEQIPEGLKRAWRGVEFADYSGGANDIVRALKSANPQEKEAAEKLHALIMEALEKDAADAWALGQGKQYYQAHLAFAALTNRFRGYEIPAKYVSAAKWLADQPSVKQEISAAKTLDAARGLLSSPQANLRNRAIGRLNLVINRFPETQAAKEAQALLEQAGQGQESK
jgi:hypothetical protein